MLLSARYQHQPIPYTPQALIYLHNQHLTPFPEDDEIQFLLTNLKEGDHVLDIGANIGLHAIRRFCFIGFDR